jgi:large subunit ribosomal protein L3
MHGTLRLGRLLARPSSSMMMLSSKTTRASSALLHARPPLALAPSRYLGSSSCASSSPSLRASPRRGGGVAASSTLLLSPARCRTLGTIIRSLSSAGSGGKGGDKSPQPGDGNSKALPPRSSDVDDDPDADDDEEEDDIQTIHAEHLTKEQIEEILREEEALMEEVQRAKFVENWKPGMKKRPLRMSYRLEDFGSPNNGEQDDVAPWTLRDKRTGLLAIKVGMVPIYDDLAWGTRYPCTVLHVHDNVVVGHKTHDRHGYSAVQIGAGRRKRKNVGVSVLGQYRHLLGNGSGSENDGDDDSMEDPPYLMREFRVNPDCAIPVGSRLHASHFVPGQNVDVSATSSGKGFQGGMKRHGFAGLPASHGVSRSHRSIGSTGQCQDPGKVFKGKKMPGRMGGKRITTQNLRVVKVDRGRNLIYVMGSVPGKNGNFVEVKDAVKRPLWNTLHVPDKQDRPPLPTFPYDNSVDGCGAPGHEVFMPLPDSDPFAPDEEAA